MAAGSGHVRLASVVIDRAADRLAVDGDAFFLVPAVLLAETGRGPVKLVGIDLDHDIANAVDARALVNAVDPAASETAGHRPG